MKLPSVKAKVEAFSLVELLVVIFVLVILAALLLPISPDGRRPAYTALCMNNQKQIAIGTILWNQDHNGRFPWQISSTNSGSMEAANHGYAAPNFRILSDYLKNPTVFVCPTDKVRTVTTNLAQLRNQNLSYFAALESSTNIAENILTGDRHLQRFNDAVKPGLFVYSNGSKMSWTHELHPVSSPSYLSRGVLSFADGHAEQVQGEILTSIFQREGLATNRLCIP